MCSIYPVFPAPFSSHCLMEIVDGSETSRQQLPSATALTPLNLNFTTRRLDFGVNFFVSESRFDPPPHWLSSERKQPNITATMVEHGDDSASSGTIGGGGEAEADGGFGRRESRLTLPS